MKFQGIYPALLTPFDAAGRLNEESVGLLIDHLLKYGVDGFYVGGSTGEGLLMQPQERRRLTEVVIQAVSGRAKVIVHVGANATDEAAALARHAAEVGADAVSTVPPLYFRVDENAVVEHYRRVAAAGLPLIAYHIPSLTGQHLTPEMLRRLMEIPHFAGVKFTDSDFFTLRNLIEDGCGRLTFFNGFDEMMLCGLVMGADGGIGSTYNVMPEAFVHLYQAFREGKLRAAQEVQFRITAAVRAMLRYPLMGLLKAMLTRRGIPMGEPRRPLPPAPPGAAEEIEETLARLYA